MIDRVYIRDLALFTHHGVTAQEQAQGQELVFNIDCLLEKPRSWQDDDPGEVVDYARLCHLVATLATARPHKVLESLGETIALAILERFDTVGEVSVRIAKPGAPIAMSFKEVGVEIVRKRDS